MHGAAQGVPLTQLNYESFVRGRVAEVRDRIEAARVNSADAQEVTLIAVTKTHGADAVVAAYNAGVLDVGENKVQEASTKMELVEVPVRWHLIGHLQRNKAKDAVRFDLVHSMDSERLALALNDAAQSAQRVQDVLVQVNVSEEDSKSGVGVGDVASFAGMLHQCSHLRVTGVMTMAPFGATESVLRSVFSGARAVREQLRAEGHPAAALSMGMSDDFEVAVQEGATLVRLGTVLFGQRASS
ncbi:MAG: YggS family pyridoxal phosphate-dependent enzyme [Gemmatimonadaceae bacterium]